MAINSRSKGQRGEREVATLLNSVIAECHKEMDIPLPAEPIIQRNQNQSAVGGYDLVGVDGLAIEVKYYKSITTGMIDKWWEQTLRQAKDKGAAPILFYRANGSRRWRIRSFVMLGRYEVVGDLDQDDFLQFFKSEYSRFLRK